jgi:hypothetical protein
MLELLSHDERECLLRLSTPEKIQDFLDRLPANLEEKGETHLSVRRVLRERTALCIEGALLAAAALVLQGEPPLIMDLVARKPDVDHVVALYRYKGYWGAISKTNHPVLRYRDPIYRSPREVALSYFHEYFLDSTGEKTLKTYSRPLNLSTQGERWLIAEDDVWELDKALRKLPHYALVPPSARRRLRPASRFERSATAVTEWKKEK